MSKSNERKKLLKHVFHKLKSDEGFSREELEKLSNEQLSPTETVETYIKGRREVGDIVWIDNYTRLIEPRTCPHCSGSGVLDERLNDR